MSKRVWILSEVYFPEDVAVAHYVTGLSEGLASEFDVCVITGQPTYDRRGEHCPRTEYRNGVRVVRCAATTWDKNILPMRAMNALSFSGSIFVRALKRFNREDVVLVGTNPPLLPFVAMAACRAKQARCIVRLDDVYPDAAIAAGLMVRDGLSAQALNVMARILYERADGIILMGRCMADLIRQKSGAKMSPAVVIPNWADVDDVKPSGHLDNALRVELGLQDKFIVLLAGNLGRVQGLEILVQAAHLMRDDTYAHFVVVGTGAKEPWLREEIRRLDLTNITLAGVKPRSEQNTFLSAGDVALITLAKDMVGVGVPSRLYNCMAAGVPIIAATGRGSEPSLVVEEEDIGWTVDPEDGAALANAIRNAKQSGDRLHEMGHRARHAAETRFGYKQIVGSYCHAIGNVSNGRRIDE